MADGGEPPRHGRRREAAGGESAEIFAQILRLRLGDAAAGVREIGGEVAQVLAIRSERILAGPALGREHVEEKLD